MVPKYFYYDDKTRKSIIYLVIFAGVSEEVSEKVEAGTFSDQDEVSGAISQVSSRWEAFGAARTSTAHTGSINSQELPSDCPPLAVTLWNINPKKADLTFSYVCKSSLWKVSKLIHDSISKLGDPCMSRLEILVSCGVPQGTIHGPPIHKYILIYKN